MTTRQVHDHGGIVDRRERLVRAVAALDRRQLGPASLRRALANYAAHYLAERLHQGIGNVLIEPSTDAGTAL